MNMEKYKNKQSGLPAGEAGLIRDIVLILVALVALKYFFDFDLIGMIEGPVERGLAWVVGLFK